MGHEEIIKKLIGPINPIGETNEDKKRLENLRIMCDLVQTLIIDINYVSTYRSKKEYSMQLAGVYADSFLKSQSKFLLDEKSL